MKPLTQAWLKRQRVHRHNSFVGHARMMQAQCQAIIEATSTTDEAKDDARLIYAHAADLAHALKKRIDP